MEDAANGAKADNREQEENRTEKMKGMKRAQTECREGRK